MHDPAMWSELVRYHSSLVVCVQSTSMFPDRESLMNDLEKYGGVFDCQKFRDVTMYSLSVFSFSLPRAMEVLADCILKPCLTEKEVCVCVCIL